MKICNNQQFHSMESEKTNTDNKWNFQTSNVKIQPHPYSNMQSNISSNNLQSIEQSTS